VSVRREAPLIRVEVRDLHRLSCRSSPYRSHRLVAPYVGRGAAFGMARVNAEICLFWAEFEGTSIVHRLPA
jgi:hypothetical protein